MASHLRRIVLLTALIGQSYLALSDKVEDSAMAQVSVSVEQTEDNIVEITIQTNVELGTFAFGLNKYSSEDYEGYYDYDYDYEAASGDYVGAGGDGVNILDTLDISNPPEPTYMLLVQPSSLPKPIFVLNLVVQADVLVGFIAEGNLIPVTDTPLMAVRVFTDGLRMDDIICLPDNAGFYDGNQETLAWYDASPGCSPLADEELAVPVPASVDQPAQEEVAVPVPAQWSSCEGHCSSVSPVAEGLGLCFCDAVCTFYEDCCEDATISCLGDTDLVVGIPQPAELDESEDAAAGGANDTMTVPIPASTDEFYSVLPLPMPEDDLSVDAGPLPPDAPATGVFKVPVPAPSPEDQSTGGTTVGDPDSGMLAVPLPMPAVLLGGAAGAGGLSLLPQPLPDAAKSPAVVDIEPVDLWNVTCDVIGKGYTLPCSYDVNVDNQVSVQDVFSWLDAVMDGLDAVDPDTTLLTSEEICPVLGKTWQVECARYDLTQDKVVNVNDIAGPGGFMSAILEECYPGAQAWNEADHACN